MTDNTPKVEITCRSVVAGSTSECLDRLLSLVKDELQLSRDQVVSISIHDTRVRHGDLEAVIFYRTYSIQKNSEPLADSLSYQLIERDEDTDWEVILSELLQNASSQQEVTPLSIAATFRNVGDEKIACLFSAAGSNRKLCEKRFSAKASWTELLMDAEGFLNMYIMPQDFHSIVLFEEEHPLEERERADGTRNLIVYHYCETLTPIVEKKPDLDSKIYILTRFEVNEKESWNSLYSTVLDNVAASEQIVGHYIATATSSDTLNTGYHLAVWVKID
jgi:hypothetical protein